MPFEVSPRGTRGGTMPRPPAFLVPILMPIMNLFLKSRGMRVVKVTTVGAKSGQERVVYLTQFPEADGAWLVVGSAGGAATHPAWVHNMAANPDRVWIEVEGQRHRVRAETLSGPARAAAWARIVAEQPVYAGYEQSTDREIPIVRLTRPGD